MAFNELFSQFNFAASPQHTPHRWFSRFLQFMPLHAGGYIMCLFDQHNCRIVFAWIQIPTLCSEQSTGPSIGIKQRHESKTRHGFSRVRHSSRKRHTQVFSWWMSRLCGTLQHTPLLKFSCNVYLRGSCWIIALMSPFKSWRAFRHNLPTIYQTIDRHTAQDIAESCIAPYKVMPLLGCRINCNTASSKQPEQSLHSTLARSVLDMARILQPRSSL